MADIPEVTLTTFDADVLNSPVPVLLDMYAPWCGPCQAMSVVLPRVAQQLGSRARLLKINTDNEPELAALFNVSSIPTLLLLHRGKVIDRIVGLAPAKNIVQMVDRLAAAS